MAAVENTKLKKLFENLLHPEFKIKNETYLSSLLDHLKESQVKGDPKISNDDFMQWLRNGIKQWEKNPPPPNILTFALNLSIVHTTEEVFVKLNSENIFEKLIDLVKKSLTAPKSRLGVKLSYINLLTSFLNHKCGVLFIISTNYWSQVIDFVLNSQTVYIRREGCKFIASLLQKSVVINEWFCYGVIQALSSPLQEAVQSNDAKGDELYRNLRPTLLILNQVFANLLEICGPKNDVKIFKIVLEKFAFEKQIRHLQSNLEDEEMIFELYKILFTLSFFDFVLKIGGRHKDIHLGEAKIASQKMFDIFLDMANGGPVANFLKLLYVGVIYWEYIKPVMPLCKTPESIPVTFENQLLALQLFPVTMANIKFFGNTNMEMEELWGDDEHMKDAFMFQMTKYITADTFRTTFKWKNYLQKNFSFDHATLALKYVLQTKKFYTRDTAKRAFQMITYFLADIKKLLQKHPQKIVVVSGQSNYICMLLETLTTIINDFEITWKDCIESICVLDISAHFLSYPIWSSKVIVRILKLMEVGIAKYMSPNMALLVDSFDNVINMTLPILYAKTHDGDWEVRDSALEIIRALCHFAKKFPSLRKTILDAEFPSVSLKIAKGDMEPYVRATAYKCLQEMVEIHESWNNLLTVDNNVLDYFIRSLHQESEGMVRKEIATVIAIMYEFQEIPEHKLPLLYDIMSHAVVTDLHWEVKVKALDFWQNVLERHLMDQGVIDGSFPKITFSKEHRKIVTLNEMEIKRRLVKILNQLSEIGCLAVFIAALQDDCDVDVSKKAVILIKKFVEMLKQHRITNEDLKLLNLGSPKIDKANDFVFPQNSNNSPQSNYFSPQNLLYSPQNSYYSPQNSYCSSQNSYSSPQNSYCSQDSPNGFGVPQSNDFQSNENIMSFQNNNNPSLLEQDSIIDEILSAQDLKLLETVYNSADEPVKNSVEIKKRTTLSPTDFLHVISGDFEEQPKQKEKWLQDIDSFNSLLDDILSEYKPNEANDMDCY